MIKLYIILVFLSSSVVYCQDSFNAGFEFYGKDLKASEKNILDLGAIRSTPLIDNGIVYFGGANGTIYAIRLIIKQLLLTIVKKFNKYDYKRNPAFG